MGNSPASSECHRRVRTVLQGCEGVAQIKDDVLVFGTEEQHEGRLRAVLERFREAGLTLRKDKCKLGEGRGYVVWSLVLQVRDASRSSKGTGDQGVA